MYAIVRNGGRQHKVAVGDVLNIDLVSDEVGGTVYLASLAESVASASNAVFHAQIVRDKSVRRRLIQTSSEILTSCFEAGEETESLLDQAEQQIFSIAESKGKPVFMSSKDLVQRVFEQLEMRAGQGELGGAVHHGLADVVLSAAEFELIRTATANAQARLAALLRRLGGIVEPARPEPEA